jgi:hypothetical protein
VISPRTRQVDREGKRRSYAAAGVEWYLLAEYEEPSIVVLHLEEGAYRIDGEAVGDERVMCPVTGIDQVPSKVAQG